MNFDELELYYLRRMVMMRIDTLNRNLSKNRRYFRDTDDDILYQNKIGNLEAEIVSITAVRDKINRQIAFLTIRDNVDFRE